MTHVILNASVHQTAPHAMSAAEAGIYLAEKVGLQRPVSAARMWRLARTGMLPVFRMGRRVWFQSAQLDEFVAQGGTVCLQAEVTDA